ncbi:hypothetical protein EVG20_g11132 [Dentipellis fragilis]|uniref:F-box domain-containing protein n=1 Tax=Dentipellis fragilis TaxID=205917 RepID=A0A4Y9XRK5_9AGAM|nr:hypothetical protein EVG20_g11132 [Dentipellis fragilis]
MSDSEPSVYELLMESFAKGPNYAHMFGKKEVDPFTLPPANGVAYISRLSSETLAHIFSILQVLDLPYVTETNLSLGWLKATFVCRQWRSAALSHAYLWSEITVEYGPKWVEAFL